MKHFRMGNQPRYLETNPTVSSFASWLLMTFNSSLCHRSSFVVEGPSEKKGGWMSWDEGKVKKRPRMGRRKDFEGVPGVAPTRLFLGRQRGGPGLVWLWRL